MSALRNFGPERRPAFRVFPGANGNWIVEGPRCGGVFVDEVAAQRFVHEEERAACVEPSSRSVGPNVVVLIWKPPAR